MKTGTQKSLPSDILTKQQPCTWTKNGSERGNSALPPKSYFLTIVWFTFSLYSSLMMEQFKMEGGSSLGMGITLVTVSLLDDATASTFSLRIFCVWTLLWPWAKKLLFSYRMNLGFTERVEWLLISAVTLRASPVKWRIEIHF